MKTNMQKLYKNFFSIIFFCVCANYLHSHAAVINPVDREPPVAQELIFQNRSILKCGMSQNKTILTLLDVQVLLSISNVLLENIPLTTDWDNFSAPKINLYRISNQIPPDILRILFLCLNWQDAHAANLFTISDTELQNHLTQIRQEQPWKIYSAETQKKINNLSDEYLKELLDMVLKAKLAQPVRGDLKTNQTLRSIKYSWLL